jgi:hypothetical protein
MVMAFDEGSPAPPPAPVAHLPRLPSNAEIVCPRNADVSLLILRAVLSRGAHRPGGNTYRKVAALCGRTRLCVAGERLKPHRSPTRKKMVTCFPPLQPACRLCAHCAADAQRMRSGCAADAQWMWGLKPLYSMLGGVCGVCFGDGIGFHVGFNIKIP